MSKRALCVGINKYPYENMDLKGCVNDATAWAELFINHFDFPRIDVKLIFDSETTKKNIIIELKNLLAGAKAGDVLVFTNSSHGSYIKDTSGDERIYDQVICPFDVEDNVIVDDELREMFVAIPAGVNFTVISDSCHSGTITRIITPDYRRKRFLNPSLRGEPELRDPLRAKPRRREKYPEETMKEILIAGCKDNQFSYDAQMGSIFHGAMSFFALQEIRAANYNITYADLVKRVVKQLDKASFNQQPQLEGKRENKSKQIFV
ncbi:MAG TPA: caspase family protein [bacterium]